MVQATLAAPPEVDGTYLVGEFVGQRDGKPWTGRDGETREPVNVSLLVGQSLRRVQYPSLAAARAAIPEGVQRGDRLALLVYPRANGGDLYWDGPRARDED